MSTPQNLTPHKTVAVTGASGFVGSALVRALCERHHQTVALIREQTATRSGFGEGCEIRYVGDLHPDTDWRPALSGVDTLVHCAARQATEEVGHETLTAYRQINVEGTRRLAQQAVEQGVKRLIFLSSVKALGERSSPGVPLTLEDPSHPGDAYGLTKWEAEQALREIAASTPLEVLIVRPPLVYGPHVKGNFLRLLSAAARGVPLPLDSIRNLRSMIYIGNLVDFLAYCVVSDTVRDGTFLVSDGEDVSTPNLVRKISSQMNQPSRIFACPPALLLWAGRLLGKEPMMMRMVADLQISIDSTIQRTGWTPPYTLDQGLKDTVAWFNQKS